MHDRTRSGHRRRGPRAGFGRRAARLPAALLLAASAAAQSESPAAIGERVPDHQFSPLVAHDGRTRLSELVGQPVLLAGWRRNIPAGLHGAYVAHELYMDHGEDGLLVILQDRERWDGDPPWVEDVDFWYRFFGSPLWITESVAEGGNDVNVVRQESALDDRSLVLIGVDGRLLIEARADYDDERYQKDLKKRFDLAVDEELRRARSGWGEDRIARKARGLAYGKGELADALRALDGARDPVPEHDVVREEVERLFAVRRKTVEFLLAEARFGEAEEALDALEDGVRGVDAFEAALAPLVERLGSDEGRALLKEDRALARILEPYTERELDDLDLDFIRDLRAFAAEHAGSPVGGRARELDPLLKRIVRILRKIPEKEFEERVKDD